MHKFPLKVRKYKRPSTLKGAKWEFEIGEAA